MTTSASTMWAKHRRADHSCGAGRTRRCWPAAASMARTPAGAAELAWGGARPEQLLEPLRRHDRDAEPLRLRELRTGAGAGDDEVGLLRDGAGGLAARGADGSFRILPAPALDRAGDDDGLARERPGGRRDARRGQLGLDAGIGEILEDALARAAGREPGRERCGHRRPDAFDLLEPLGLRPGDVAQVRGGALQPLVARRDLRGEPVRELDGRGPADLRNPERRDDPLQWPPLRLLDVG